MERGSQRLRRETSGTCNSTATSIAFDADLVLRNTVARASTWICSWKAYRRIALNVHCVSRHALLAPLHLSASVLFDLLLSFMMNRILSATKLAPCTSLKVNGLRKLVKEFAKTVHGSTPSSSSSTAKPWQGKVVFVNNTPPSSEWNGIIDYHVEGDSDTWVEKVVEHWKKMRPANWEVQQSLVAIDGDVSMSGGFKTFLDNLQYRSLAPRLFCPYVTRSRFP
ncbi:hypothetical protein FPV67DRAFT_211636 [Lyophyllum atratum]|nr:hypothetical protein FPV67DRAFT_211636 [Lyophyllum atratum]